MPPDSDPVAGPIHYLFNADGSRRKFEPREVLEDWGLDSDHYLACAVEYICRSHGKQNFIQDIRKAIWNLERRLELEERRLDEFRNRPTPELDDEGQ